MNSYELELIVDGKLLAKFHTKQDNGKDAKFVANALLNDRNRWQRVYLPQVSGYANIWHKTTQDGRKCYLEIIAVGIPNE